MPKISILTPCYNVKEEWLSKCLESLLNQTLQDLEFICIDDGSKDDTLKRLKKYAAKDSRIKLITKPNSGYGDSMNMGLSRCTGEYVGIVEPDDWVELDMFEKLYSVAKENDLDLARCCFEEYHSDDDRAPVTDDWIPKGVVLEPLKDASLFMQAPGICITIAKREMLEENNIRFLPTPGASFQDMSYGFKMKTCAKRFMLIPNVLHHYRINENSSVSQVSTEQKAYCVMKEWDEIYKFAISHGECYSALKGCLPMIEKSCYSWNLERLGPDFRYGFIKKWQAELLQRIDDGQVDLGALQPNDREYLEKIAYCADEWFDSVYPGERRNTSEGFSGKVSVIITMYKNEDTIRGTIGSVAFQSYQNIEIICVDDASPDRCAEIVTGLSKRDERIKLIRRAKNGGLSACRNTGIDAATGEAVMFVDGDDELLSGAIERLAAQFDSNTDAVFSSCKIEYCGGKERYGHYPESDKTYYAIPGNDIRKLPRHEIFSRHCSAGAKMFRLKSINDEKLRFPEGMLFEDAAFTWRYFSIYNNKVSFLKEPVYLYRRRNGSIMSNLLDHPANWSIQDMKILDGYLSFLRDRGLLKAYSIQLPPVFESIFWFAFSQCAKYEKLIVLGAAVRMLHEFDIQPLTNALRAIASGNVDFFFPQPPPPPPPPPPKVVEVLVQDERLEHRLVRAGLKIDNLARKIFPPGETKTRRAARAIWNGFANVYHFMRGRNES